MTDPTAEPKEPENWPAEDKGRCTCPGFHDARLTPRFQHDKDCPITEVPDHEDENGTNFTNRGTPWCPKCGEIIAVEPMGTLRARCAMCKQEFTAQDKRASKRRTKPKDRGMKGAMEDVGKALGQMWNGDEDPVADALRKAEIKREGAMSMHRQMTKPGSWLMLPVWVPGWCLGLVVFIGRALWDNFKAGYRRVTTNWTDYRGDDDG